MFDGHYLEIACPDRQAKILIVAPTEFARKLATTREARTLLRPKRAINRGPTLLPHATDGMICRFAQNCPVKCRLHNETLHI